MNIFDYTYENLNEYLMDNNFKKYNTDQIFDWVYKKNIYSYEKMTNLKKELVDFLLCNIKNNFIKIEEKIIGKDVIKYLFKLNDNNYIEAVLMKHNYGNSICVSSQVGCNMGCAFCESGRLKKVRDLETYEMIQQVLLVEKDINKRIDNLVIMGIGEPFDNYDKVINFVKILKDNKAINLGSRKITISTCGIIPKIEKFMNEKMQVNLAISLHASNDKTRSEIMNINKVYPMNELLDVIDKYIKETNRRVTIEYIMLQGINDSVEDAVKLSKLFKGKLVYINLIPYNINKKFSFIPSKKEQILKFYDILKKNNINVTIRREFGLELNAACGQLRAKKEV